MTTSWFDALQDTAIEAYASGDASQPEGMRLLGAALNFYGIAMNGGLVGGGVENMFFTDDMQAVLDAAEGFRRLDMKDVATLVDRAHAEYLRFRPTGSEELSDADVRLWDELDQTFFHLVDDDRLLLSIRAHLTTNCVVRGDN